MADEKDIKAPAAPKRVRGFKLANGKVLLDVPTQYGTMKVTDEKLEDDKFVAMLQRKAPNVFSSGLVVEK